MYTHSVVFSLKTLFSSCVLIYLIGSFSVLAHTLGNHIFTSIPRALGLSKTCYFRIINHTYQDIVNTHVYGTDPFDWIGRARPDRNLHGLKVPKGETIQQKQEINKLSKKCLFNIMITFSDGTVDEFQINQKYALGGDSYYQSIRKSHDIEIKKEANIVVVELKNTKEQMETMTKNNEAEQKHYSGEEAFRQKQFKIAIQHFNDALNLASEDSTRNAIESSKAQVCNEFGLQFLLEDKLEEARFFFQEARSLFNNLEYDNNLFIVECKIDGNRYFNEGNVLEEDALKLLENAEYSNTFHDYSLARNKFVKALGNYQHALRKFQDGFKIDSTAFDRSVEIVNERINGVEREIFNIDNADVTSNIVEKLTGKFVSSLRDMLKEFSAATSVIVTVLENLLIEIKKLIESVEILSSMLSKLIIVKDILISFILRVFDYSDNVEIRQILHFR